MAGRIDITQDIQPLTTFRNNSVEFMKQLKETKRPIILTVNGKPEAVLQDPAAYQRLLDPLHLSAMLALRGDLPPHGKLTEKRVASWSSVPSPRS